MKKILAIDFGTKRIGLAINHHTLAEPFKILSNDDQVLTKIVALIEQLNIELVLVGMSENKMAKKITFFTNQLKSELAVPVEFIDETLSSKKVHQKLADSAMKLKKRQGPIDHYAAAEFLQEWLDTN